MSLRRYGDQTGVLCSSFGRTYDLKSFSRTQMFLERKLLMIWYDVKEACCTIRFMCISHLRSDEMQTPRSFAKLENGKTVESMVNSM